MTDFSLAHWTAASQKTDLFNFPKQKPDYLSKESYEKLRRSMTPYLEAPENKLLDKVLGLVKEKRKEQEGDLLVPLVFDRTKWVHRFSEFQPNFRNCS